ncbi:MAG: toll/interleukin-1 receptor domain-containing protein [Clostridiales bacterium]|nr:toll/interleukin-1 receptor domain-containing protein [Clostridiales bacterium]
MAKKIKYDAFISYRHCSPDSEIAERLQKKLESFRIPDSLASKIKRTRLRKVFRDESELAVADDLSEVIDTALHNSEYLIAVCSPQYLESAWCMLEIEVFRQFRDRKHILLVLADGEPETAFPEVLLYDEVYSVGANGMPVFSRVSREPLAADCRGETAKERNAKTDKAVVRLVAAILGVEYDDLQQRHRKALIQKAKRRTIAAFSVLGAILAVCVFFLVMISGKNARITKQKEEISKQNLEIANQNEIITQKYADSLAATSDNLLRDGKRKAAVYTARVVLPDEKTETYSELATQALVNALGIYTPDDSVSCIDEYKLPVMIRDFAISPGGSYALVTGMDFSKKVIDLRTEQIVFSYTDKGYHDYAFCGDQGIVFQRDNEGYKYLDLSTLSETDLGISEGELTYNSNGEVYAFVTQDEVRLYCGAQIAMCMDISSEVPSSGSRIFTELYYVPQSSEVLIVVTSFEDSTSYIFSADLQSGSLRRVIYGTDGTVYNFQTDGKRMIWMISRNYSSESTLYIADVSTFEVLKTMEIDSLVYQTNIFGEVIVTIEDEKINVYDENLRLDYTVNTDYRIDRSELTADGIVLFDESYGFYLINEEGDFYWDFSELRSANYWIRQYLNGKIYISSVGDNHIGTYGTCEPECRQPFSGAFRPCQFMSMYDEEAKEYLDKVLQKEKEYEKNQIYDVIICENADLCLVQLWDGSVYIYSSSSGDLLKKIYSIGAQIREFYFDEKYDLYYISSDSNVDVYDSDLKNLYRIPNCYMAGIDDTTGDLVVGSIVNDPNYEESDYFLVHPLSYEELIAKADAYLGDYEPDAAIKEKYGLG